VPNFLTPVRPVFRAVAETVIPETAGSDDAAWDALEGTVVRALASRPAKVRRQLATFLRAIEVLPVARHRTRFTRLPPAKRADVLARLERSPLLILRRGFWGLRSLILIGWYAREDVAARIGYRATAAGWVARRAPDAAEAGR
jgi:hypothetical protein